MAAIHPGGHAACGSGRAATWRAMTGRHGQGRHGPGGGPGGFPFGAGSGGFPGGPFRRRSKARRGDVRTAVLLLLAEEPRNGYQLMQELEQRSDGAWRPSAGSIYPAIQLLEDEGLVRSEADSGRTLLHLTDAGRKLVEERDPELPAPWEQLGDDAGDEVRAVWNTFREIASALAQITQTGSETQRAEARRLLAETRRTLYLMLADGGEEDRA
ncbi:MAG TPA: PadR family transcriptional regulator [Conexibacter sp.]|nr:PadR family transcriptional regulator [Conexibacter sp.]